MRAGGSTGTAVSRVVPDRRQPEGSARPVEALTALFGEDVAGRADWRGWRLRDGGAIRCAAADRAGARRRARRSRRIS